MVVSLNRYILGSIDIARYISLHNFLFFVLALQLSFPNFFKSCSSSFSHAIYVLPRFLLLTGSHYSIYYRTWFNYLFIALYCLIVFIKSLLISCKISRLVLEFHITIPFRKSFHVPFSLHQFTYKIKIFCFSDGQK